MERWPGSYANISELMNPDFVRKTLEQQPKLLGRLLTELDATPKSSDGSHCRVRRPRRGRFSMALECGVTGNFHEQHCQWACLLGLGELQGRGYKVQRVRLISVKRVRSGRLRAMDRIEVSCFL